MRELTFFGFLTFPFLSVASKTSPQNRHMAASDRIISPHAGQGRRLSGELSATAGGGGLTRA